MQYKTGTQDYLGITIDYDREKDLNDFSLNTLKDRYFWEDETYTGSLCTRFCVQCNLSRYYRL